MKEIVDPILCIFALIRVIYYCNDIAVSLVNIENQTTFIQFVDIYALIGLNIKISPTLRFHFQKCIFIFRFKDTYCIYYFAVKCTISEKDNIKFSFFYIRVIARLIKMLGKID